MSETINPIVEKAIADAVAEKALLDKTEAEKAVKAEKVSRAAKVAPPTPAPSVRLRVIERFAVNPGDGLMVFQRGDVLKQGDFEPRVWGDILEMLDRKVAVL
jgi:hypothetical protein